MPPSRWWPAPRGPSATITGLDVIRSNAVVRDGQIAEYHVTVKLAFIVEPANIDSQ